MRFQVGMAIALGLAFSAFNFTTYPPPEQEVEWFEVSIDEDIPVVRTATEKPKKIPPPVIKVSDIIIPTEEIEFIEEKPVVLEEKIKIPEGAKAIFVAPKRKTQIRIKKPIAIEPEPIVPVVPEFETFVDEMPRFDACAEVEGGNQEKVACANKKLLQYVGSQVNYPNIARENNIEGLVVIQFIVEKDGSISNAKIARDIGGGCGTEALRVVKKMPNWVPGRQRNKLVRVKFSLPVKFDFH